MTATLFVNAISFNGMSLNAIAQTSAVQIVDCLVEGTLVAIFAGLMLSMIRRNNSGTRFAVWFSALMAIATLPLLGGSWWLHASNISAESAGSPITVPGSWALYAFGAWAAIAAWFLFGVGRGLWHLHVLRKSCLRVNLAEIDPRVQETLGSSRSTRPITLCTSDLVRVPTAIGFLKPLIVVPGWVMQELSADELNQILLHELAHLRRWDDWTNLAQKVVKAFFFFHPAVWWIEKKISLEREMACDDAVIAETASPRAYAECLTHLAERTLVQRSMALAQAALGRIRQTSLRVAQILDVNRPTSGSHRWKPAVSLVAGFAVVCVLGISRAPRLIAFRDSAPSPIASPMIAAASPRPVSAQVSQAKFLPQPVHVVPASLKALSINRSVKRYVHTASIQSASTTAGVSSMVRPSTVRTSMIRSGDVRLTHTSAAPVAFTETLFVVIEGSTNDASNQPVYQIQWWRVTVLHPVVAPSSNRIPAKQT
jgi:beta-lactamase regulating signal transducer with metallopeptidase domain